MFGGTHFIQPTHRLGMRGLLEQLGVCFRFLQDLRHCLDKGIQLFLALGLGGLDQQAFRHQQGKIGCRRMYIVIQQAFCKVHGRDSQLVLLPLQGHNELMGRTAFGKGHIKPGSGQFRHQVIGIQRGKIRHPLHAFAAQHAGIDIGAQEHAGITHKGRQPTDTLWPDVRGYPVILVTIIADNG